MNALISTPTSRRRFLFIGAVLGTAAAMPPAFAARPIRWSGQALGAHARIELIGANERDAPAMFQDMESEIARLEAIFSLYKADSVLTKLNRDGVLFDPPPELVELLSLSQSVHRLSGGLFDPTVQPLFAFYANWFAHDRRRHLPTAGQLQPVLANVGMDKVSFDDRHVRFERPGMALTFNGIAQGYITDRIAARLRDRGFGNTLLDIGEIQAIGRGLDGEGWRIGIQKAPQSNDIAERLTLSDRAVATSMMLGTTLDRGQTAGHILHPALGLVPRYNNRASVIHRSAALADGLSTAAILMAPDQLAALRHEGLEIRT